MELFKKVNLAIQWLQSFEPESEPYYLCYSGGKDSDCIRILAKLANVKHEIHHNLTTVDAPETIYYIKQIPGVIIDKARYADGTHKTMWNLIVKKHMPPTRLVRYCCAELKEQGGKGHVKITGVRKAESPKRQKNGGMIKIIGKPQKTLKLANTLGANAITNPAGGIIMNHDNDPARRLVESCYRTTSTMINPILDWSDDEVWEFLKYYGCEGNPLYKCGKKRIGCIGCPMQSNKKQKEELNYYPIYRSNYINAFDKMLSKMSKCSKWQSGIDVYKWWVGDDPTQMVLDGLDEMDIL